MLSCLYNSVLVRECIRGGLDTYAKVDIMTRTLVGRYSKQTLRDSRRE